MTKRKRSDSNAPGSSKTRRMPQMEKMMMKKMERMVEKKGYDTDLSQNITATTNTNANINVVNIPTPGTASYNRLGRKTYPKSLRIQGVFRSDYANDAGSYGSTVRMVVVWDKQPSGTLPTFDTIFSNTLADGTEGPLDIFAPIRYDNMDRFKVLRDVRYTMNPGGSEVPGVGATLNNEIYSEPVDEYLDIKGLETVYSGQTSPTTIADVANGGLYVVFRGDFDSGSGNITVLFNGNARFRFTD